MNRTIHLTFTARQERGRLMNHLIPGVFLILAGVESLPWSEMDGHVIVSAVGMVVGAVASILIVREIKIAGKHAHHSSAAIRWVEVAVAAVIALEAAHRYNPRKTFQPAVLYGVLSLITLGQGLFPEGFPTFRKLVIDENGFRIRRNPFIAVRCSWKELSSARFTAKSIDFTLTSGKQRILRLGRIGNAVKVSETLHEALQEQGIECVRT